MSCKQWHIDQCSTHRVWTSKRAAIVGNFNRRAIRRQNTKFWLYKTVYIDQNVKLALVAWSPIGDRKSTLIGASASIYFRMNEPVTFADKQFYCVTFDLDHVTHHLTIDRRSLAVTYPFVMYACTQAHTHARTHVRIRQMYTWLKDTKLYMPKW